MIGEVFDRVWCDERKELLHFDWKYVMGRKQNCYESVYLSDVCGDLSDLEGVPILKYEESKSDQQWTISTIKGSVTLRWNLTDIELYRISDLTVSELAGLGMPPFLEGEPVIIRESHPGRHWVIRRGSYHESSVIRQAASVADLIFCGKYHTRRFVDGKVIGPDPMLDLEPLVYAGPWHREDEWRGCVVYSLDYGRRHVC